MKLPSPGELAERIAHWIIHEERAPLRPVINATGIPLHTGLGRAPLAEEAIAAIVEVHGTMRVWKSILPRAIDRAGCCRDRLFRRSRG